MSYTVGQAAKATGRSKPTISRAIKAGTISATRNADGSYTIDPAELHRVFPPVASSSNDNPDLKRSETPVPQAQLEREIELLRELMADKDGVIDDLRQRLDREGEERRQAQAQLTALLTDQREQPGRRSWWRFGRRA
jgi:excisionase family DNA binding protein